MKKFARLLACVLCLALLLPCLGVPASATDGETVLYHQLTPSSVSATRAVWPANTTAGWLRTCTVLSGETFKQIDYYNNYNSTDGGLPEGESMCIELPVSIDPSGYAEVALSLQYAICDSTSDVTMSIPGRFQLYTSADGGANWSAEHATLFSHRLVNQGTTSDSRSAQIFQLSTTDIACLLGSGTHIDRIKLRPYGDANTRSGATRIHWIDVIGYDETRTAPVVPGDNATPIAMSEADLRNIVVQRMYQIVEKPWTTDTMFVTYNSNGYSDEDHTQYYHPGWLYLGPSYTRPTHTTWEMFCSIIDGGDHYTGPTTLNKAWGMDCIRIVSAALTSVSNARHDTWARIMYEPSLQLLGGVLDVNQCGDSQQIVSENDKQTILRGYAATHPGDFALHYFPSRSHIRLVTLEPLVVYESDGVTIDANNSKLYLSETGGTILYYWEKPNGTVVSVSGNAMRSTYGSDTEDPAVYQAAHPDYTFLYATSCRKDKAYTFQALYEDDYVAYTMEEYGNGAMNGVEVVGDVLTGQTDPVADGFMATVQSNWRLASVRTALTNVRTGTEVWSTTENKPAESFVTLLKYDDLDTALAGLGRGKYAVTVDVTSGPMTEVNGALPVNRAVEVTFGVGLAGDLNGDGKMNGKDISLLQRHVVGGYGVVLEVASADMNDDGTINGKDVSLLQRAVAGGYGASLPW